MSWRPDRPWCCLPRKTRPVQASAGVFTPAKRGVLRARAGLTTGGPGVVEICTAYEAGYDGFWLYRALTTKGIHNLVLDFASIQVSRRRRRVNQIGAMPKTCCAC